MNYAKRHFQFEIIDAVGIHFLHLKMTFLDQISCNHFKQFQDHNITSNKWSDLNNERFYHVKQTVENGWRCDITIRSL